MPSDNGYHVAPRTGIDHEFSSGSKALLAKGYPIQRLILSGAWDEEALELLGRAMVKDAKIKPHELARVMTIEADIVCAMWIRPKVCPPGTEPGEGETAFLDLPDTDIEETLALAMSGGVAVDSFPGDGEGAERRTDGAVLADQAERPVGVGTRQRGGVTRGRKPRAAASGSRRT